MKKKRTYSSVDVEKFEPAEVVSELTAGCIVAIDVAKTGFYAGIATPTGEVLRIVRFAHPKQTPAFLAVLETLRDRALSPQVVMEPTGSYGDALRYQCLKRGLPVFMTCPKHTHDMAEVLDGVPSMHDAKAVVVLSKLHAIRPGKLWEPEDESRRRARVTFDRREVFADSLQRHHGRLEALLARYWPGLDDIIDVHRQRSWMLLLEQLPDPALVASHEDLARQLLRRASHNALPPKTIEAVIESACGCLGVPMQDCDRQQLKELVAEMRRLTAEQDRVEKELKAVVEAEPALARVVPVVGVAAAVALLAYLGMPADYDSAGAMEKAAGLNLKVRSSGKTSGQLRITKRGPSLVRKYLHMAVLRLIRSNAIVRAWYVRRDGFRENTKLKAVTAVTRKLIRALWHIARHDVPFDATKLFDTRLLKLEPDVPAKRPSPRFAAKRSAAAVRDQNLSRSSEATA